MSDQALEPCCDPDPSAATAPKTPTRRRRKLLKRGAIFLLVVLLIGTSVCLFAVKDHIRSLYSFRRVPNTKMYVMDYYGDYKIAGLAANGVDTNDVTGSLVRNFFPRFFLPIANWISGHKRGERQWHETDHSCSSVSFGSAQGDVYFGRNFDWKHDPCLVVRVHGRNAPSSVAVLEPFYLQLDEAKLQNPRLVDRLRLLFAPYLVFDGMNDRGVAISSMSASESKAPFDKSKPTLIKPMLMRLVLDYAGSADDAVELLRRYNVDFDGGPCHFMIADASGKSLVVEFVDGRLETISSDRRWQVSTNHLLRGKTESQNDALCPRYRIASDRLADTQSQMDMDNMMDVMSSISAKDWTMWTSVYCLTTGDFRIAYRRNFEDVYLDRLSLR